MFHVGLLVALGVVARAEQVQRFETPDILVLGDSQITFGAGPAYLAFFQSLARRCAGHADRAQRQQVRHLKTVAVIGVRSTALREWSARGAKGKADICEVDPVLKKNAGAFGTVNLARDRYVQIGEGTDFQFCRAGASPLETAIAPGYYQPKLLVLSFLGNASRDWADDPDLARRDARVAMAQVPDGLPCVFMTTVPSFQMAANNLRVRAQANIRAAMAETGGACTFVGGVTDQTIALMTSDKRSFRVNESGEVKDPFHPTHRGAQRYLRAIAPQLCSAILSSLDE